MKRTLLVSALALALVAVAAPVFAAYYSPGFTLKNESQCVGGTLVLQYSDVADTGGEIAAKDQAVQDCQWLMTGPGQCCDVNYRRSTPQPPAIGSHVWMYEIYEGATISSETSPSGTLTSYYQRWAGIGGGGSANSCTGTWQVESTDLSDASCPITTNVNNLPGIYSAVPTCSSSNPEGTACSSGGICKRNVLTSMSGCVIETTVYSCTAANGSPISNSCTQNTCTPETYNDQWYTGTFDTSNAFNERLGGNYDCALWAQQEGFTYWNQSTIYRAGEYDPYDVVCTGLTSTNGTVPKPRVTNILGAAAGSTHEFRSGKVCPGIAPPTASIVANPNIILRGEQSMLTWSSTNANSCTGTNFNTGGATSGSVMVSPSSTTQYSVSCTGSGGTGSASATVTVTEPNNPQELSISCRAAPTNVGIGENVIWSSSVSGPQGLYYYSWSGTEDLSGNTNTVTKSYEFEGIKSAWLTVTFKPYQEYQANQSYSYVPYGEPSYTKICSGGTNSTGIGGTICGDDFPSCSPGEEGRICSAVPDGEGCDQPFVQTGDGVLPNSTMYGTVQKYRCSAASNGSGNDPEANANNLNPNDTEIIQLPPGSACPAIGWATPVTPCDGMWEPTYSTGGCQNGWQCVPGSSGGGLLSPQDTSFLDTIQNFLNIDSPEIQRVPDAESVNGEVLGASTPPPNSGNYWMSTGYLPNPPNKCVSETCPNGVGTMPDPVSCSNEGATCQICDGGAVGSDTAVVELYECRASSGQCALGQSPVTVFNPQGYSCTGGSQVFRSSELLDGVMIGNGLDMAQMCGAAVEQEGGTITEGDCCEVSLRSSTSYGGGFPANSFIQVRVVKGGTVSQVEVDGGPLCSPFNLQYLCSSVAGYVGTQCVGGPGPGGGGGGTIVKTVQCENSVNVGTRTYQCSDNRDNEGDGRIDFPNDPGCYGPQDDDEQDGANPQCSDGRDNDGDGDVDTADGGCSGPGDDSEGGNNAPQCSDGIDNDGDGNADYPDDLGCSSANDNDESSDAGQLTLSISPSLIKKGQMCTLTVSASSVQTCSLTGPGVSRTLTPTQGNINASVSTPAMTQSGKYTLSCVGIDGRTVTKTADCRVAPSFEEF